ncbi:MAG: exonuclease SbcCD subunit D [Anaerolineales bacterium]|jgi:exonuclease SbcD
MVKILHFSDAHIDIANYGRQDPASGLPLRVLDFLKSLDTIIDTAIEEKVDLVIFSGDAYKDRNPAPTFQREWGRRIIRLAKADIPILLLIGNHDLSPSLGRAHALEEYNTLEVEKVIVADRPTFYTPDMLMGVPVQIIAIPWISRSGLIAHLDIDVSNPGEIFEQLEERITDIVNEWLEDADPELPTILTAHASIQGAVFGGERTVMLGQDMLLSGGLVRNKKLDYVAMGHIHKAQDLNEGAHPPVVYPGSIERVDFGEARDKKFFVVAEVEKGKTSYEWRELTGIRKFIDPPPYQITSDENVTEQITKVLPPPREMDDAIVRLTLEYPREWETLIDDAALRELTSGAFEFHLIKRPRVETRIRIPEDKAVGSMTPEELLDLYWKSAHTDSGDKEALLKLAREIIEKARD